ncbi:hypothetical protein C0J52_03592 [Blattella germanica]|nr:hypothetical protein C0J52_03592 [Blattella germanica]
MLTKEESIAVVSARLRGMTYEQTRADFAHRFRKPGPTRLAIKNLVNKFQRTGSVADEERPGRPALPQHTVQNVQNAITRSPSASTRRLSRELGIPQTTVWRTLRYKLKKHAYHLQTDENRLHRMLNLGNNIICEEDLFSDQSGSLSNSDLALFSILRFLTLMNGSAEMRVLLLCCISNR